MVTEVQVHHFGSLQWIIVPISYIQKLHDAQQSSRSILATSYYSSIGSLVIL